jgi:hypothetical protein
MLVFIKSEGEEDVVESSRRMKRQRSISIKTGVIFSYTD